MKLATAVIAATLLWTGPLAARSPKAPSAVTTDPLPDAAYPANVIAFQLPTGGMKINALLYLASGEGPHPALLLLHGFPGNEQNLDLAQAARRAGWDVLTLHYRGSWGSEGAFSFTHSAEDAITAARWLLSDDFAKQTGSHPTRIAVAGHSMGGMMAARAAADVSELSGAFLIDPWDIAGQGRQIGTPQALAALREEVESDIPPLAGTSVDALIEELRNAPPSLDLHKTVADISSRPLALVYAERGLGADYADKLAAAKGGKGQLTAEIWPTDHSFSDHRIKLASTLVRWLERLK
jgi:pimeloyl-ACP methyl ester carboxylesterase